MSIPRKFKNLVYLLDRKCNFKTVLIVNTNGIPQTGEFLDHILEEKNPVRIQYTDDTHNEFIIKINELTKSDKKFDLICLDPYHTYDISLTDYNLLTPLLSDNGILISHDCYPPEYRYIPTINPDGSLNRSWCGETYVAFVKFSEENPHLFYAVIKYDVGLGIISKTQIKFVKNIIPNDFSTTFLNMFKNNNTKKEIYDYFKKYDKYIINLIK